MHDRGGEPGSASTQRRRVPARAPVPVPRRAPDDDAGAPLAGCRVTVAAPGALLVLSGRLDVRAAADVRLALASALAAGEGDLVVDLAGVVAVDATGLGVLVGAHRQAGRAGRALVLRDPAPAPTRALLITRLDRVLRTVRSPAAP